MKIFGPVSGARRSNAASNGHAAALAARAPSLRGGPGSPQRRAARALLVVFDVAAVAFAAGLVGPPTIGAWVYALAVVAFLAASGGYYLRISLRVLDEFPSIVRRLALPSLLILFAVPNADRRALITQAGVTIAALCASRASSYALIRHLRRIGKLAEPAVIVGSGEIAIQLDTLMSQHPEYGLRPIGFVDSVSDPSLPRPMLGHVTDLGDVLHRYDVQRVIIAFGLAQEANWVSMLRTAVIEDVEVHVVPRFFDVGLATGGAGTDEVWGIPLLRVRRSALRTTTWQVKRVVDMTVSALLLLVAAPLLAAVAVAVRFTSRGPILFRQVRIGQNGQEFELLKFRSMRVDHDGGSSWDAPQEDLTPIGGFLRRTSIDELPQLWNVLQGDMSLVGPRPERPAFAERFSADIPGYRDRHRLAVGLTGWAQVHGLRGDETSLWDRARFDNRYIEGWSLWLDLVILLRTFTSVVKQAISPRRAH